MLLTETLLSDGETQRTSLAQEATVTVLRIEAGTQVELLALPPGAVQRVMERYGKPPSAELDDTIARLPAALVLADQSELCHLRYLPRYEVIAKDYLVWRVAGREALVELAVSVAAALTHLGRAWQTRVSSDR